MRALFCICLFLSACANSVLGPAPIVAMGDPESAEAHKEMCVEENVGFLRFSHEYLEKFCADIKTQTELTCLRFVHDTKEWRKACPGVDTADKLECIAVLQNGHGYAEQASLEKCRNVKNRRQVYCLSRAVANSGVPLLPVTVQECLDKNG